MVIVSLLDQRSFAMCLDMGALTNIECIDPTKDSQKIISVATHKSGILITVKQVVYKVAIITLCAVAPKMADSKTKASSEDDIIKKYAISLLSRCADLEHEGML